LHIKSWIIYILTIWMLYIFTCTYVRIYIIESANWILVQVDLVFYIIFSGFQNVSFSGFFRKLTLTAWNTANFEWFWLNLKKLIFLILQVLKVWEFTFWKSQENYARFWRFLSSCSLREISSNCENNLLSSEKRILL